MLSDPDRHPARTVPPLLILAWTGTVIFSLLRESALAAQPDADETATAPQAQDTSRAERPNPSLELRRQLQEYRRHRQRNGPRDPEAEEQDAAYGSYGAPAGRQRSLTGPGWASGSASAGSSIALLTGGPFAGFLTGSATLDSPLSAPLPSPFTTPLAPPLTAGLFEMSAGPMKGPVFRQRRPSAGAGGGMRLNELERALLRQQLREVLRVPGGRDTR